MQEWSQQLPHQPFLANDQLYSSSLAEPVEAVADCGDLSYLFTDYDFLGTTTFGTSDNFFDDSTFLDNTIMGTSAHQPLQEQYVAAAASRWPSTNSGLENLRCAATNSMQPSVEALSFRMEHAANAYPDHQLATHSFCSRETSDNMPSSTATSTTVSPLQTTIDNYGSSTRSSPKKRPSSSLSSSSPPEDQSNKRQRNTEAARRYRQRKVDRVSELEDALAAMTKANDDLKLKLARSEAEADVLRGLVSKRP